MIKRKLRSMVELKEFLKNPSPNAKVPVYTGDDYDTNSGDHTVKKPTLSQRLDELIRVMNTRFDNLEKRIDNIDARLDYIVEANNLKDRK